MTERTSAVSRRRGIVDVCALVLGAVAVAVSLLLGPSALFVLGAYGVLLGTSTSVVTYCLLQFTGLPVVETEDGSANHERRRLRTAWQIFTGSALQAEGEEDTGWLIGRLENVLVLTLILVGQYTALSIIFAAKSWVRHEDTASSDSTYYLAGTLVNFTYSIVVGLVTLRLLG